MIFIFKLDKLNTYCRAGFLTFASAANPGYVVKSSAYYRGIVDKVLYYPI